MGNTVKIWKDPFTGKDFSYGWGFDTEKEKMPRIEYKTNGDSFEKIVNDEFVLKEPAAITKAKEALDRHIMKEMEKAIMSTTEKISYVCGRCRENKPCNPYCVGCEKGSKFVERPFDYVRADMEVTKRIMNSIFGANGQYPARVPAIKDVKFNPPATIVFWADKTKTVVKAQGTDVFDPEKGLAMAIIKKLCGNKGNYNNVFHKWLANYTVPEADLVSVVVETEAEPDLELRWRIWYKRFNEDGKQVSAGVLAKSYAHKNSAIRRAKIVYEDRHDIEWIVSKTNPWGDADET